MMESSELKELIDHIEQHREIEKLKQELLRNHPEWKNANAEFILKRLRERL